MAAFAALTVALLSGAVVLADTIIYGGENEITVQESAPMADVEQDENIGAVAVGGVCTTDSLGGSNDPVSQLCNVNIDLFASGTTTIDTLQTTFLGSSTTAATSTGYATRIKNTGGKKLCGEVVATFDQSTVNTRSGAFSVGTSTTGTMDKPSIIATTTIPTSSDSIFNHREATAGTDGRDWFELNSGDYVVVNFSANTALSASSTEYAALATKLYVECRTR